MKDTIRKYYLLRPLLWGKLIWDHERSASRTKKPVDKSSAEYIQYERCVEWFRIKGDETLRLNYPLNANSIVFDVGGFEGEFASAIYNKYGSTVYVFEPLPDFFELIKTKFSHNEKIKVFAAGLSDKNGEEQISFSGDRSSLYTGDNKTTIKLKRAADFIRENNLERIHLMKLNIEGAEYALLEDLLQEGLINRIENIQVQFHDFIFPNAKERMNAIQSQLSKTHELSYQFEFVWENWRLKK